MFNEKELSALYNNIPSDCTFRHAHPTKPFLLDYFCVEFHKENPQWKSRYINFVIEDENNTPQEVIDELPDYTSSSSLELVEDDLRLVFLRDSLKKRLWVVS